MTARPTVRKFQSLDDVTLSGASDGDPLVYDASSGGAKRGISGSVPPDLWMPQGAICETFPRDFLRTAIASVTNGLGSGVLRFAGPLTIPRGRAVHSLTLMSGATALAGGAHQWFCLIDQGTFEVLAVTGDDTSNSWAARTMKTLALAADWTPDADTACWLAVCVVATTQPSFTGTGTISGLDAAYQTVLALSPRLAGNSGTSGLTTPLAVGTVVQAISANAGYYYGYASEAS